MKVQRVYHPSEKELLFALWSNKAKLYLVLSLENARPFAGISHDKVDAPKVPSGVCLGLRKRLEGGTLAQIRQESLDRVLYFDFSGHDELGNTSKYTLVFDAAGGKGGMGLLSDGIIELCVTPSKHRLEIGSPYVPPESSKANLLAVDDLTDLATRICSSGLPGVTAVISHVEGLGKEHAQTLLEEAGLSPRAPLEHRHLCAVVKMLENARAILMNRRFTPGLYIKLSGEPLMAVLPLRHLEPASIYSSVLQATAEYREYLFYFMGFKSLQTQVHSLYNRIESKLHAKLEAQQQEFREAQDYEKYRIWGELIHASGCQLPRGHSQIKVLDYYQDPPREICIPLDPKYTSRENARRYYAQFSKLQRAAKMLQTSLQQLRTQVARLEDIRARLGQADDVESLRAIRDELLEIARASNLRVREGKPETSETVSGEPKISGKRAKNVETLQGPDGSVAYVGMNSSGNDYIVRHVRRPGDIWLHAKGVKGAHVLLRAAPGKQITQQALNWAAGLAAARSQAASSGKVEVDWVDAEAVRKPSGSPPGFVTYRGAKTILVKLE